MVEKTSRHLDNRNRQNIMEIRGVARNLLRGLNEEVWGRKSPSGSGAEPRWGSAAKPPEAAETHAEYSIEQSHRSSQIAYCSDSDYTLKNFPATTGGLPTTGDMYPCPPPP